MESNQGQWVREKGGFESDGQSFPNFDRQVYFSHCNLFSFRPLIIEHSPTASQLSATSLQMHLLWPSFDRLIPGEAGLCVKPTFVRIN